MDMTASVLKAPPVSSIRRRKPIHTYQSPSAGDKPLSSLSHKLASTSHLRPTPAPAASLAAQPGLLARKKYPMAPPLPLYHPLGRLALSLPPLEPSTFGHSAPISIDDSDSGRPPSARSRRPAAKVRDAEDDEAPSGSGPISNVSAIAAVAAREIKEKALSPRKKRGGGGKRKRKDLDDADATYPAKRATRTRGAAAAGALDEESPSDSAVALPEVTPTPEPGGDDGKRPERRATRSGGMARRRDSTASSGSGSVGSGGASKGDDAGGEAKEDGEVSEEAA
ncbi:hypothetical protein B0H15DRAFT_859738 [Mycena belliarum]|uniref:Uncharacterized protein n=1 Tax=Mycena belliarum TaxID=1033014 RepID=A0AAD6TTP8_9AGAR|nr:hypothetical protein B0H15DRAFT_859738 [Mycena belliae]